MTIGEVATRSRVNIQTVRYYERRGLLPAPRRSTAGYRQYPEDVVPRIRFIKRAQELGFTPEEIAELLALLVRQELGELENLKRVLEGLVEACERRAPTAECPILEALEEPLEHA